MVVSSSLFSTEAYEATFVFLETATLAFGVAVLPVLGLLALVATMSIFAVSAFLAVVAFSAALLFVEPMGTAVWASSAARPMLLLGIAYAFWPAVVSSSPMEFTAVLHAATVSSSVVLL